MKTNNLHPLLDDLRNHLSQQQNDQAPALLEQIRMRFPLCMGPEMLAYLEKHNEVKNTLLVSYLNDCRYILNLLGYAEQGFLSEEYMKLVRISTDLFHVAALLQDEEGFIRFKAALTDALKQHRTFRAGFRNHYFSLANKNRNASLELILNF